MGNHRLATGKSSGAAAMRLLASACLLAALSLGGCAKDEKANPVAARYSGVDPIEAIDQFITEHPVDKLATDWKSRVPRPPVVAFPPERSYYWVLDTSAGLMKIQLRPDWAPHHVSSTIYLTRLGFYDGLTFHRIIPGFMAQGGDPTGTGGGGPGYRYAGEFHKKARHDKRGVLSMANAGPRTDGSQFFLLFKEAENLDGKHTVFGRVTEGLGTLRALERYGTKEGQPTRRVTINRAEVIVE